MTDAANHALPAPRAGRPLKENTGKPPPAIRRAMELMVRGLDDDQDCKPLDLVEAAKAAGVAPLLLRRWLDRPGGRAFLQAERRSFREAICAANESALQRIRDKSPNAMAQLGAIKTLELINEEADQRGPRQMTPGFVIQILDARGAAAAPGTIIDVSPMPAVEMTRDDSAAALDTLAAADGYVEAPDALAHGRGSYEAPTSRSSPAVSITIGASVPPETQAALERWQRGDG